MASPRRRSRVCQLARRSEIRRVAPRAVRAAHAKQLWKLATELGAEYAEAVAYAGNMPGSEPSWSPGECEEVRAQRPLEVFDLSIQAARRFCELARDKEQMELEVEARSDLSMIVARKILYLGWSVGGRNYAEALKVFHDHEAYAKTFHTQEGWYEYPASEHPSPASDPIMRWAGAAIAEALLASPEYREQGLALVEVYPQDRDLSLGMARMAWQASQGTSPQDQAQRAEALAVFRKYAVEPPATTQKSLSEGGDQQAYTTYGHILKQAEDEITRELYDRAKLIALHDGLRLDTDMYISLALQLKHFDVAVETVERHQAWALRDLMGSKISARASRPQTPQPSSALAAEAKAAPSAPAGKPVDQPDRTIAQRDLAIKGAVASGSPAHAPGEGPNLLSLEQRPRTQDRRYSADAGG